jgi:hypothetical protein
MIFKKTLGEVRREGSVIEPWHEIFDAKIAQPIL